MQRCFFLLIFYLFGHASFAQNPDLLSLEYSLWFQSEEEDRVHARALIYLNKNQLNSIKFDFIPNEVNYVKLREGRLKKNLTFIAKDQSLIVDLSQIKYSKLSLEVDFFIDLEDPAYEGLVNRKDVALGFNLQNLLLHKNLGLSGAFFPSLPNDLFIFSSNITLPKKINSGTPGLLEFEVDHQNSKHTQFWKSEKAISAEDYYLVIGDFKDFDAEDIEDDLELEDVNFDDFLAREAKNEFRDILRFIEDHYPENSLLALNNEEYRKWDSLGKLTSPFLWVKQSETTIGWRTQQFEKEQLFLLELAKGDTLRASLLQLQYLTKKQGEKWRNGFLESKWSAIHVNLDSAEIDAVSLTLLVLDWLKEYDPKAQEEFINGNYQNLSNAYWESAKVILKANKLPKIAMTYNYRDGYERIFISQDSTHMPAIKFPYQLTIYTKDTTKIFSSISKPRHQDTILYSISGAPQALSFYFGEKFPGDVIKPRSDLYDLYLFANAPKPEDKKAALVRLFQTKNKNLYSTVLGIAMDNKDPKIRLQALQNAGSLNIPAQQKLKETLRVLAQNDPDQQVRLEAKKLVLKYYGQK